MEMSRGVILLLILAQCLGENVKISYAILDIISVQSKFTTVAYVESLKETQSQDRHNIYLGKPSRGIKPNKTYFV